MLLILAKGYSSQRGGRKSMKVHLEVMPEQYQVKDISTSQTEFINEKIIIVYLAFLSVDLLQNSGTILLNYVLLYKQEQEHYELPQTKQISSYQKTFNFPVLLVSYMFVLYIKILRSVHSFLSSSCMTKIRDSYWSFNSNIGIILTTLMEFQLSA